ncbi:TetR/AcrR family transcriptional regulator [Saccharibacillus sp. CPCC 101409]|uniref:TetR/AcrR family transcriptional regulator n=1 Tax=Saccharibacillus sp. CPCC 101409 TaxID=3058041 RepID=UPI002671A190|nr:TetR/AcrR family transcriptional regulator [Saccharibacillus sp. CPCC 101409]MDO3409766.1 TetR/AcrR family transcriptional regulator [Saccharibacillus sp. CPCC 101409]
MSERERSYHHGDLRETLIRTSLELISEVGVHGFSVAKVAKRAGVSSGAPYRHFPDRESLLMEAGVVFLNGQIAEMRSSAEAAGSDPVDRLASTAGAYVRYAVDHFIGVELFGALRGAEFVPFNERKREMIGFLFSLTQDAAPRATWSQIPELMDVLLAVSQGFSDMYHQGMFAQTKLGRDEAAGRATAAVRYVIQGWELREE